MKKITLVSIAAVVGFMVACNSNDKPKDSVATAKTENKALEDAKVNSSDKDSLRGDNNFMVKAASGGMLEVELGKIALKNAASSQVKQFGEMMIKDHTKANHELTSLAASKHIAVPVVPGNDEQDKINKLQQEHGKDFDKDYVKLMIDDHKDDIKEFQHEADNANDSSIKALALKTIPVLQKHLDKIQAIDSVMNKK